MSNEKTAKSGTVLVVDDDPEIRLLATEILRAEGYTVFEAEDASRCMKWLNVVQPSLILLDVNMPEVDGYRLCKTIRETYPSLPATILFVTSNKAADDVMMSRKVGGDYFLTKPFTAIQLVAGIKKAVIMKRRQLMGG
jgi:two-component system OmpR family response regulator